MSFKFYQPFTQQAARQSWSLDGLRIQDDDAFTLEFHTTHVKVKATTPLILKKGHNTITLPSLTIVDAVLFLDVAQELLNVSSNISFKNIWTESPTAPSIVVFCKEDFAITNIAELYLAKGSYR